MNYRPTRTAFLAAGVSAIATAAVPGAVQAQSAAPLSVGAGLIEPQAQAYYAQANGFFKARGRDATIVTSANAAATTAAVAGGTLQVGITSVLGLAQAIGSGLPFATF